MNMVFVDSTDRHTKDWHTGLLHTIICQLTYSTCTYMCILEHSYCTYCTILDTMSH